MLKVSLPLRGEHDYTEFHDRGDAAKRRSAPGMPDLNARHDYVFLCDNVKGSPRELWQYVVGRRHRVAFECNRSTSRVEGCELARTVLTAPACVTA